MCAYMYIYFRTAWLIGHNQERYEVRNANTSWGSGTRPGSLPVEKTRKQMISDREMPEDCRRQVKVPYQGKKVLESFLEEGVFELGRGLGARRLQAALSGQRVKGRAQEAGQAHHGGLVCSATHLAFVLEQNSAQKKSNMLSSKTISNIEPPHPHPRPNVWSSKLPWTSPHRPTQ